MVCDQFVFPRFMSTVVMGLALCPKPIHYYVDRQECLKLFRTDIPEGRVKRRDSCLNTVITAHTFLEDSHSVAIGCTR